VPNVSCRAAAGTQLISELSTRPNCGAKDVAVRQADYESRLLFVSECSQLQSLSVHPSTFGMRLIQIFLPLYDNNGKRLPKLCSSANANTF
jgi:hypothetical protein